MWPQFWLGVVVGVCLAVLGTATCAWMWMRPFLRNAQLDASRKHLEQWRALMNSPEYRRGRTSNEVEFVWPQAEGRSQEEGDSTP